MSTLLSTADLLELELANLPKTRQGIEKRAKKEGWAFEIIAGQGRGGKLKKFLFSGLPADVQAAIREKQAADILAKAEEQARSLPVVEPGQSGLQKQKSEVAIRRKSQLTLPLEDLMRGFNQKQKDCAHARMALAAEVLHINRVTGLALKKSVALVIQQAENGTLDDALMRLLPVANDKSKGCAKVGARTLLSWVVDYKKAESPLQRLVMLAPKLTKVEKPLESYVWLPLFLACHARPQAPQLTHSYDDFCRAWLSDGKPLDGLPSLDMVRRVWNRLPEPMRLRGRKTGAGLAKVLPHQKRNWDVLEPNDVWIGDGHSFKAKVAHPATGKPFKPEVTVVIDGCTRMVMGFSVSLAESCVAVCDALRIGMKRNGIPLVYYSDNGAGQTAKTLDHDVTGIAARLGICHKTGIAGHPQGRGIIERLWQSTLIRLAREYETFVGKGMDESTKNGLYRKFDSAFRALDKGRQLNEVQQKSLQKLPSWRQFLEDVANCLEAHNQRPHSGLPKKEDGEHFSPAEYREVRLAALATNSKAHQIEWLSHAELDLLFRPEKVCSVRNGWLDLFGFSYFSMQLSMYHGEKVRVAYDLDDAESVVVYDMDGRYVCHAELNGNMLPAFDVKSIREQQAKQRADRKIRLAENRIAEAKAEQRGMLEQAADLGQLLQPVNYEVLATGTDGVFFEAEPESKLKSVKRYAMFESDLEE